MANLPMDIVNDVFLRLPATTLVRCRPLSKLCFSLIDSSDFVASHLKRTLETEEHLMILLRSPRLLRTVYLDAPDKLSDVDHPLQTGGFTEVFGSVNGLIGLTNSPVDLAIFNPSSRKIHRLPIEPIDFSERFIARENVFYGLGYDSVSDDYKVVRMVQSTHKGDGVVESFGRAFEIKVFSLKSNKWKRILLLFEVQILFIKLYYRLLYRRGNGVLASNSLHWILPRSRGYIAYNTVIRFDLASDDLGILRYPLELLHEDDMDIGVLDGCLCLMCYSESSHVGVWILREYEGKWSKFITVPKPETVVSFEFVRPMIYSKDRSKILLEINNGKLMWFDLESKGFETLGIKGCEGPCNAEIVVSSLVLGCKGDPRRAQEKKMMLEGNKRLGGWFSVQGIQAEVMSKAEELSKPKPLPRKMRLCFCFFLMIIFSASAYDPLDPNGNITIKWDIMSWTADGYVATVTMNNFQTYRHIQSPGWTLGWAWAKKEVIWSMVGAQATEQGDCSKFKGNVPHCCKKTPTVVDLLPGVPYNQQISNCCKGGVVGAWGQDPSSAVSQFQVSVGLAGTTNKTVKLPKNFTLLGPGPGYTCGPAKIVPSTVFLTTDKRRKTQALNSKNCRFCYYSCESETLTENEGYNSQNTFSIGPSKRILLSAQFARLSLYSHVLDKRRFYVNGAGLFTGVTVALYPVSVVKTRLQVASKDIAEKSAFSVIKGILKNDGVPGLYRGFGTVITGAVPARIIFLTALETTKISAFKLVAPLELSEPTQAAIANGIAGMTASLFSQAVFVPIDVVSQKLMVQGYSGHAKYTGGIDVATKIIKSYGVRGLYRGFGLSVMTYSPSSAAWWASYGSSQRVIWRLLGYGSDSKATAAPSQSKIVLVQALGGIIAGATASSITTPLDTIKTRLQVMGHQENRPSAKKVVKDLIAQDGWKGFYRGLGPRFFSMSAWGTSMILTYEYLSKDNLDSSFEMLTVPSLTYIFILT
ncbi:unnamed protein product [Brassica napus]|uniref:(rape) hypothetical protein n=1 Tax=Brassica napus TaxID=3708 RepID=A0A816I0F6_BRANA|nr:unnamed protein product [Brassica napus]